LSTASRLRRRGAVFAAAGALILVHALALVAPETVALWSEQIADRFLVFGAAWSLGRASYDGTLVHVDLNNTSLRALENYHPDRADHARVVESLARAGVGLLMADFVYAGPTAAEKDRALAAALGRSGRAVLGIVLRLVEDESERVPEIEDPAAREYLRRTKWSLFIPPEGPQLFSGTDPLVSLAEIAEASRGAGFLTLAPDRDGVVRRLPLLVRFGEGVYPSFALKAVCELLGVGPETIRVGRGTLTLAGVRRPGDPTGARRDLVIPVDGRGRMRLAFTGPWGSMRHYHFADLYRAASDPAGLELWAAELSGKIVLMSDISTGSADIGQVPLDPVYPLSGVHANAVNTILTESFVREVPPAAQAALEILALALLALLSLHRSALVVSLGAVLLGGAWAAASGLALLVAGRMLPAAGGLLALGTAWAGMLTLHALDAARARAATERARELAERELEIGRRIQRGFIPEAIPVPDGWEIAAHFQPARQVSGDFYDVFELGGGRYTGIAVADVCDHGLGSALFMVVTRSLVRAFARRSARHVSDSPAAGRADAGRAEAIALDTVRQANAYLAENHGESAMFATLFFGLLDPRSGEFSFVNAGHEPAVLICGAGAPAAWLSAAGLAVGALPDPAFQAQTIRLAAGDRIVLYTDGVTDAEDSAGRRFSRERLAALAAGCRLSAAGLVAAVVAGLERHRGGGPPADDVTLLAVMRKGDSR
jgi:serine phosphatase RsbU (regulator of sigma subunit)